MTFVIRYFLLISRTTLPYWFCRFSFLPDKLLHGNLHLVFLLISTILLLHSVSLLWLTSVNNNSNSVTFSQVYSLCLTSPLLLSSTCVSYINNIELCINPKTRFTLLYDFINPVRLLLSHIQNSSYKTHRKFIVYTPCYHVHLLLRYRTLNLTFRHLWFSSS